MQSEFKKTSAALVDATKDLVSSKSDNFRVAMLKNPMNISRMAVEIERKFLVEGSEWRLQSNGQKIIQGYLSLDPKRVVRIRRAGDCAFITIKGPSQKAARPEFEYSIPVSDAESLLSLCVGDLIEKVRNTVTYDGKQWEIDEFTGANSGLVLAEIELRREDEEFRVPSWVGREVTDDQRYYNSSLAQCPFSQW